MLFGWQWPSNEREERAAGCVPIDTRRASAFPMVEYVIVYRVEDADVPVLHVYRGSRDIEGLLRH
jgi:hypothetical protein